MTGRIILPPMMLPALRSAAAWLLGGLVAGLSASAATRYVWQNSPSPGPPFATWATAAHNIQDAVDAATAGDTVLVAGGVYDTGGRAVYGSLTNRVAIDKPITVQSVNGRELTVIRGDAAPDGGNGDGAVRCACVGSNTVLTGFTLTNGHTRKYGDRYKERSGGGVWCETSGVISNCILTGNSAKDDAGGAYSGTLNHCTLSGNSAKNFGGGARESTLNHCTLIGNSADTGGGGVSGGTLYNCILTGNSAVPWGGGAFGGTLHNCTLAGNSANEGGGAYYGTLHNCIVFYNTAPSGSNYLGSFLDYSCATPLPTNGLGNITNAPLLVDWLNANLRLQPNSPCINAGHNAYVAGDTDADGLPRIAGGTVDIGAYEFPSPASVLSYAWLQQYALPTDGSADFTDPDNDRLNNWQEWRCLTDPTNALSVLRLLMPSSTGSDLNVTWQSVAGVSYRLQRSTNLGGSVLLSRIPR